jgi:GTP-binding protein
VFTKTDKNKPGATTRNINTFMAELSKVWTEPPLFFSSSAVKGDGKKEILDFIESLNAKL